MKIQTKTGIYMEALYNEESNKKLEDFCLNLSLNSVEWKNDFHTTILFSKQPFDGEIDFPMIRDRLVFPKELKLFSTNNPDMNALVLTLEAPQLVKIHKEYMKRYNLAYDFDEYQPHVTLAYIPNSYIATKPIDGIDFLEIEKINITNIKEQWLK